MKHLTIVILTFTLLTGCTVTQDVLDDLSLITFVGYDLVEDDKDKIKATVGIPIFEPQGKIRNEFLTAEGEFGKDLEKNFMLQSSKPPAIGKLEVTIFGEDFAKKGISEATDVTQRDPTISSNLKLAVFEGRVEDFVKQQNIPNQDLGIYVANIIEHNIASETIPKTNIHLFFQSLYADGIDPFLPLFNVQNGAIKLKGLALFQEDEMVSSIDEDVVYRFTLLRGSVSSGNLIIQLKDLDAGVSLAHISSKRMVKITGRPESPKITLDLKLKGFINEYYGDVKEIEKQKKKIEKSIDKQLTKELKTMIQSFQKENIDPIGFGKEANGHFRNWDEKKWKELYPDLVIDVKVKVDILESGVIR